MKDIIKHYSRIINFRFITIIVGFMPLPQCLGFFKSIPDTPPVRQGYLPFTSPPKLRFHEVEALADRRKLLRLKGSSMEVFVAPDKESDKSDPSFPLVSYNDENVTSPIYVINSNEEVPVLLDDQILPPNDPFVAQDLVEPNLNNTDELIEILESGINSSSKANSTNVNFVPPFTLDSGNLIIESKSRYTRRHR